MRGLLIFVCLLIASLPSFAGSPTVSTSFSGTTIQYDADNSLQDDALVMGVRVNLGFAFTHTLELALDSATIHNDTPPDLNQYDYTAVYSYFLPAWKIKFGLHYIESEHDASDGGTTIITGVTYSVPYSGNFGIDLYYTSFAEYGDLSLAGKINGYEEDSQLTILQLTPKGGINFADDYFYTEFEANYIQPSENPEIAEDSYASVKGSLYLFLKKWTLSSYLWMGSEVFAVKNGGFSVYNSTDKHISGSGVSVNYAPTASLNLTIGMDEDVTENPNGGDDFITNLTTLSLGYNF